MRIVRPVTLTSLFLIVALSFGLPVPAHAQQPMPQAVPQGATYEVGFAPYGTALSVVLHSIESAKTSINVACYEFTSRPIADALILASKNGIRVAIVADYKASLQRYSLISYIAQHGVPVRRDAHYSIMHNKFIVADQNVETGSFNYTTAAIKSNAENAFLIYAVPDIAAQYLAEWQRLWDESR